MHQIPEALAPLAAYRQFILYRIIPDGVKAKKLPINPHTLQPFPKGDNWQQDPTKWVDGDTATQIAAALGRDYGVGFLFRAEDPFFFLDIDNALQPGNTWSQLATYLCQQFAGAAIEVSQSGKGLHIIGTGTPPPHACRRDEFGLELYHEERFVALTGTNAIGSAATDCSGILPFIVNTYFPPSAAGTPGMEWTDGPVAEWNGPADDDELIERALQAKKSAGAAFSEKAGFAELWHGDVNALARTYPEMGGKSRPYNESQTDMALAQHLAFWTGKDCERIQRLMMRSALVRDKWEREDYLPRTILRAVSLQTEVYSRIIKAADNSVAESLGAGKLRASSDEQRAFAESIRAAKLAECSANTEVAQTLAINGSTAKFWIDNKDQTPEQLAAMLKPVDHVVAPFSTKPEPETISGYQFLTADLQIEHFKGCVYIQDQHRIFTPTGAILKEGQFNATYGGYVFQLDDSREKTTRKAWEAFTESQLVRFPKVETTCFRPDATPGGVLEREGRKMVNTYVPVRVRRLQGDPEPFLVHLRKVLPHERDQSILLAYMAACVQYPGVKFQWAPLLQGTEGNGKTLFTRCVAAAIGEDYVHLPPAAEISEKFNEWLFGKLFIGIEDVYVPDHKREIIETLKPMITNDRLSKRAMQQSQIMGDNRANFMLNSNHKDAIRKTRNDRRFAVFYTAQQSYDDVTRDGMTGDYFPRLYNWLKADGYAIVAEFLATYEIPAEINPAGSCHRAPETSSTREAVTASLGSIEQEIMEAVEEGRPGFAGGWVSSFAVDRLLQSHRAARAIPPNKRRELLQSLGYDWHPGLKDGRVNNPTLSDAGKPRLFIKAGHILANLTRPSEIVKAYDAAQTTQGVSEAAQTFGAV